MPRQMKFPEIPLTEYVVREHWDTGHMDINCANAEAASECKKTIINRLMRDVPLTYEAACRFVSCHLLMRIDL